MIIKDNLLNCEADLSAEWIDSAKVAKWYSIKKQTLYRLHKQRKIISKELKSNGASRGKRLWHHRSIRAFINSCGDGFGESGVENFVYIEEEMTITPLIEFQIEPRFKKIVVPLQR